MTGKTKDKRRAVLGAWLMSFMRVSLLHAVQVQGIPAPSRRKAHMPMPMPRRHSDSWGLWAVWVCCALRQFTRHYLVHKKQGAAYCHCL